MKNPLALACMLSAALASSADAEPAAPVRSYSPYAGRTHPTRVFWGDTHNHSANSGDAFMAGDRLSPEQAYRFARGEEVVSSTGVPTKLARPLDFLCISDHAEGLGVMYQVYEGNPAMMSDLTLRRWHEAMKAGGKQAGDAMNEVVSAQAQGTLPKPVKDPALVGPVMKTVWQAYTETAEKFNEPGRFTAMIAYEWTSVPGGNNLHRNILFRDDKDKADQILPFSSWQSEDPEKLKHVSKQGLGKTRYTWHYTAAGYAAVWAADNTREALWDAMKRKEVYATSGTRMTLRFFGGWGFGQGDARVRDVADAGYAKGVPMGADLPAAPRGAKAPSFLIAALKDPMGANLDRVQVVKGCLDADGKTHESIYDVAWGDAERRKPGAGGKLPPVGDTVDVARATWTNTIGDPDLTVAWSDPDFDAKQPAFYYVRVIEIPTPRWTAYDALRFGVAMSDDVPMKHQERAWTSPIWYAP